MVGLTVKDGKIETRMVSDPNIPVYDELGQGIVALLVDFQVEAVKKGNDPEMVKGAFEDMLTIISENSRNIANEKIKLLLETR